MSFIQLGNDWYVDPESVRSVQTNGVYDTKADFPTVIYFKGLDRDQSKGLTRFTVPETVALLEGRTTYGYLKSRLENKRRREQAGPQDAVYAVERSEPLELVDYPQDYIPDNPATRLG